MFSLVMHFMFLHEFVVILNCVVYDAQFFLHNYSQSQQVKFVHIHVVYLREGDEKYSISLCVSTLPFKCLGSLRFLMCLKLVSYGHQGYIYFIKHTVQA